jgi:hypothetical protein
MLRNRLLILLGGCLLAASAAWADDVGYIDCGGHPEQTQVFAKARVTHEVVASLPCGERFTILQYGFIFSRIQTRDGKVGYVYSNVISVDRSGASVPPPTSTRLPAAAPSVPATTGTVTQPSPSAAAQPQAASAQPAPTQAPATTSNPRSTAVTDVQANPATPTRTQPMPAQPAPIQPPRNTASVPEAPVTPIQPTPTAPTQPQAGPAQLAPAEATAPAASIPELTAAAQPAATPATQPDATPAAQPESTPAAEAAAPAIQPANATESWEKPNEGIRTTGLRRMPLVELFGGYGFTRLDGGGGTWSNLNGVVGSLGWNVKPWLQLVADTSYDFVTVSGTKTVLYGNHYGPRLFGRMRNRWGITPFVEGLVGGSRADVTVSGTGGYSTSYSSISYKVGGGLDLKPSRHFEIRLIDIDYYRTSFGTNVHQNNYWASAGIVIRLFGGSE